MSSESGNLELFIADDLWRTLAGRLLKVTIEDVIDLFPRRQKPSLREVHPLGRRAMIQYIETMIRKEPITLAVMILMIALVLFGVWSSWPVPKVT
jgi:hypothetical protein